MFIQRILKKTANKTYTSVVLMENYREGGKVRHKIIANLSKFPKSLLEKFEGLIKGKKIIDLSDLGHKQGKTFGGIFTIKKISERIGLSKALGNGHQAILALIQVCGRILTQRSRLYLAAEWSKNQAIEEVFGINQFSEDELYANLDWLCENQKEIERKLYQNRIKGKKLNRIFLYDVTSSYLEGTENELAAYGYNRDNKKGKKQIVAGLICDQEGYPVSVEVFEGNTNDTKTVSNQLVKLKETFGVEQVIFVGDKGMIKGGQIEEITSEEYGWNYITSITKPQIEKLLEREVIQMSFFDNPLMEAQDGDIRYVLRRNPLRASEIENNRRGKIQKIENEIEKQNLYLQEHPKAKVGTAIKKVEAKLARLKINPIIEISHQGRRINYKVDEAGLTELGRLDGCYVIKTDLSGDQLAMQEVHDRYKDLSKVEFAFRTIKTTLEEIRPIFVRKEKRTRGHVFICMLAYLLVKYITDNTQNLNFTREHIFKSIDQIQYIIYDFSGQKIKTLPSTLENHIQQIFDSLNIKLPKYI
jgi:transposase